LFSSVHALIFFELNFIYLFKTFVKAATKYYLSKCVLDRRKHAGDLYSRLLRRETSSMFKSTVEDTEKDYGVVSEVTNVFMLNKFNFTLDYSVDL
jgi:hypothetical protein